MYLHTYGTTGSLLTISLKAGIRAFEALGKSNLSGPQKQILYACLTRRLMSVDNITIIYDCKSMVYCCYVRRLCCSAAYSMLLYNTVKLYLLLILHATALWSP